MKAIAILLLFLFTSPALAQLGDVKIAYNIYADTATGNYEIFVMDADGSNKKNISNSKGVDWVYYAYENKLYFVSDRDTTYGKYQLFEMEADGGNVRKIANYVLDDSFVSSRKKGGELIVTSRKDGKRAFFILDKNGKELKKITPPGLESFSDPMFLPNEKQFIFRGSKQSPFKTRKGNDPVSNDELYIINDDGTGLKQLTTYPPNDTTPQWHSYHAGPPRWNPREKFVSYISFQDGKHQVFGYNVEKGQGFKWYGGPEEAGWHDWSADGKWVAVDISSASGYDIYLMNADTKAFTRLTDDWRYEQCPVFVKSKKK